MSEWDYKGTKITLTGNGEFVAIIAAIRVVKPSLAAIKKAIDEKAAAGFKPVKSLILMSWKKGGMTPVEIVNCVAHGKRGRSVFYFVDSGGRKYSTAHTYEDTPQNKAAFEAACKYIQESEEIEDTRRNGLSTIRAKLKLVQVPEVKP